MIHVDAGPRRLRRLLVISYHDVAGGPLVEEEVPAAHIHKAKARARHLRDVAGKIDVHLRNRQRWEGGSFWINPKAAPAPRPGDLVCPNGCGQPILWYSREGQWEKACDGCGHVFLIRRTPPKVMKKEARYGHTT